MRELSRQADIAFDLVEKLYFEVAYFIKELEGRLREEGFTLARQSGYAVSAPRSSGLDSPEYWMTRELSVFFVPEDMCTMKRGVTITEFDPSLKVMYLLVSFHDSNIVEPMIYGGVAWDLQNKNEKQYSKLEHMLGAGLLWDYVKVQDVEVGAQHSWEGGWEALRVQSSISRPLFDIENSEMVGSLVVEPLLQDFRKLDAQST